MSNSTIHWHGYWLDDKCHVPLDIKLAAGLAVFFAGKSVADLGCGLGNYTMFLKDIQHVLRKLSKHFWFRKNIMVFRKHGLHHTPPA